MKQTKGTIVKVYQLWWLKVNQKAVRLHPLDGATFPYVIRVKYNVDGSDYLKWKYEGVLSESPKEGRPITVRYQEDKPSKCKIEL